MDVLWAPWRMEYILSEKQDDCFLCEMIHEDRDRENLLLARGKQACVVLNRYPYNNGHLMVAPYRHTSDLAGLTDAERLELMQLVGRCTSILGEVMEPEGFNVGINLGQVGGAGLKDHLHLHVVPRWNGDTNFMPVLGGTNVIPQDLWQTYDLLLPHWRAQQTSGE